MYPILKQLYLQFRETRNQVKVYPSSPIIDVLKQENCPSKIDANTPGVPKNKKSHESRSSPNDFENSKNTAESTDFENHFDDLSNSDRSEIFDQYDDEFEGSRKLSQDRRSTRLAQSNRHDKSFFKDSRGKRRLISDIDAERSDLPSRMKRFHQWTRSQLGELDLLNEPTVNYKRVPRRGDIGVQVIDDRGGNRNESFSI